MENEQRNMWLIIIVLVAFVLGIFVLMSFTTGDSVEEKGKKQEVQKESSAPKKTRLFKCIADTEPEYTAKLAKEVFALCPPLSPGRFDRRMWRLWGLKVSDYPPDSLVVLGGDNDTGILVLSPKYRLIWMNTDDFAAN